MDSERTRTRTKMLRLRRFWRFLRVVQPDRSLFKNINEVTHPQLISLYGLYISFSFSDSLSHSLLFSFLLLSLLTSSHHSSSRLSLNFLLHSTVFSPLLFGSLLFSSGLTSLSPSLLGFPECLDSWDMKVRSRVSGTGSAWRYAGRGSFPSLPFSVCGLPQHRLSSGLPPVHPYSLLMFTVAKDPETVSDSY